MVILLINLAVFSGLKVASLKSQVRKLDSKVWSLIGDTIHEPGEDYVSSQSPATLNQVTNFSKLKTK